MAEIAQFVDNTIASHKIVVFAKAHCPYCRATRDYFAKNYPQEQIHVVDIENRSDMSRIQDYLAQKTGGRTVPRTFINGQSIGGNSDLQSLPREKVNQLIAKSS